MLKAEFRFMIISRKVGIKMSRQKKLNLLKAISIVISGINAIVSLMIMLNKYQIKKDKKRIAAEGHAPLNE